MVKFSSQSAVSGGGKGAVLAADFLCHQTVKLSSDGTLIRNTLGTPPELSYVRFSSCANLFQQRNPLMPANAGRDLHAWF